MSAPLKHLARSAWTSLPPGFQRVKPDRKINPAEVTGAVLHWPGTAVRSYAGDSESRTAAHIASFHRYHTETRGWADIGYPKIVDLDGRIWEGAGDKYAAAHSASPGYPRANHENMAILLMLGPDDEPSEAMVDAVNWQLAAWVEKFPNMKELRGHGDVRGANTSCPGPAARRAIADGRFRIAGVSNPVKSREDKVSTIRLVSPVVGRISDRYGSRGGNHWGMDIATNGKASAVYACYAGTVVSAGGHRTRGQAASSGRVGAPYRSGNWVLIKNPDGEHQFYGHVAPSVKVGDKVAIGERIGTVDLSGITTGYHVHLEFWANASHLSHRNPQIDFDHFGVTPGASLPRALGAPPAAQKKSGGSGGGSKASKPSKAPKKAAEWPSVALRVDGDFGPLSRRAYQRLLAPKSVGNYTGKIDGVIGPMSVRAEQRWLKARGFYKGRIDGDRGPLTRRALQRRLAHDGYYTGRIDGYLGAVSIRALQRFLNDQRKHYR